MNQVTIRRCPEGSTIGGRAQEVAVALRRIGGLDVEVVDGRKGELTVLVDGQQVIREGEELPSVEEVVTAVKHVVLTAQSV